MYSPINYMKNNFLPDYGTNSGKTRKNKSSKGKSNSLNQKKLILSRNDNISNKNLILKTKTNNNNISYKKIIPTNNQFSFENISLTQQKKKDDTFNQDSLYKYISSKIKENNQKNLNHRKNNNSNSKLYSTKLDFSMSQIKSINKQKKEEKNKFNKYKGINKANKTSKNYYKKILNFPLSPGNKKVKLLKINDLDIHEVASSFNYLDKEKDDYYHKRILSSQNFIKNKISNISENNNNINDNKINSFIYQNTNNINFNVNIINKGIILNNITNNNENNDNYNSLLSFKKTKTLTHRNAKKHNNEIFNLSSFRNISINKENNLFPEEIHFKAVKYMQEIKNFDESKT